MTGRFWSSFFMAFIVGAFMSPFYLVPIFWLLGLGAGSDDAVAVGFFSFVYGVLARAIAEEV